MRDWLVRLKADLERDAEQERDHNEWRKRIEPIYAGPDTFSAECLDTFDRLVGVKECEAVWRALERRCDSNARTKSEIVFQEALEYRGEPEDGFLDPIHTLGSYCLWRERGGESPAILQVEPPSRHIVDIARGLIWAIAEIRAEPIPLDTLGRRRSKLREIEQAAEKLREAISPLWSGTRQYVRRHFHQDSTIDGFAEKRVDRWLTQLAMGRFVAPDAESVAVAYQAVKEVARHPFDYLDALVADAADWADEKPELAKPNDPNAARLLFIRRLTAYFRGEFGEPLRACVLATASAFFECSTLDESAIAKLAP